MGSTLALVFPSWKKLLLVLRHHSEDTCSMRLRLQVSYRRFGWMNCSAACLEKSIPIEIKFFNKIEMNGGALTLTYIPRSVVPFCLFDFQWWFTKLHFAHDFNWHPRFYYPPSWRRRRKRRKKSRESVQLRVLFIAIFTCFISLQLFLFSMLLFLLLLILFLLKGSLSMW